MKFFKNLNKLFEGICWFYLPVILFYWGLTLVEISAIVPLRTAVGAGVLPLIKYLNSFSSFSYIYNNSKVDYTPLILAICVLLLAIILGFNSRLLDFIERKINNAKIKAKQEIEKQRKQQEKDNFLADLEKNKTVYVLLKVLRYKSQEAYLSGEDKDPFSIGLIESYENSIKNIAKNFSGRPCKKFQGEKGVNNYIFNDTDKFLRFLQFIRKKVEEINKGTYELNTIFSIEIACSCSYSDATAETDLLLLQKILNVCGKDEILVSELLKHRLDNFKTDLQIKFESKGLYIFNEKHIDVYKMKF